MEVDGEDWAGDFEAVVGDVLVHAGGNFVEIAVVAAGEADEVFAGGTDLVAFWVDGDVIVRFAGGVLEGAPIVVEGGDGELEVDAEGFGFFTELEEGAVEFLAGGEVCGVALDEMHIFQIHYGDGVGLGEIKADFDEFAADVHDGVTFVEAMDFGVEKFFLVFDETDDGFGGAIAGDFADDSEGDVELAEDGEEVDSDDLIWSVVAIAVFGVAFGGGEEAYLVPITEGGAFYVG